MADSVIAIEQHLDPLVHHGQHATHVHLSVDDYIGKELRLRSELLEHEPTP